MQHLKSLPQGYRELAIFNHNDWLVKNEKEANECTCSELKIAVTSGFVWAETRESPAFWNDVYMWCASKESLDILKLPTLPKHALFVDCTILFNNINPEASERIQRFLFDCDFAWSSTSRDVKYAYEMRSLTIDNEGYMTYTCSQVSAKNRTSYTDEEFQEKFIPKDYKKMNDTNDKTLVAIVSFSEVDSILRKTIVEKTAEILEDFPTKYIAGKDPLLTHEIMYIEVYKDNDNNLYRTYTKELNPKWELGSFYNCTKLTNCITQLELVANTFKLNDEYTAKLSKDSVKVGCQTFSWDILEKLLEQKKRFE